MAASRRRRVIEEEHGNHERWLITYADISKAKERLGYSPSTTIEEGLTKFCDWIRRS